jgi:hypothetical protein
MTHLFPRPNALSARACRARWLLAAAGLIGGGAAPAADFSVGLGVGADQGRVGCIASAPCDRRSTQWKLVAGYHVSDVIELQALYFDAGHFSGGNTAPLGTEFGGRFKVNGFGMTAGYRWAFAPAWSLAARAGLASVRTRFDYANPAWGNARQATTQPLLGLGIGYAVTPALLVGIDYDVTRFKVHTTRGPLQMFSLSSQFSF